MTSCSTLTQQVELNKKEVVFAYSNGPASLPSWSPHAQSCPRTTLAFGKNPLAEIFLDNFLAGNVMLYNKNMTSEKESLSLTSDGKINSDTNVCVKAFS